ncbi:MAG TPA: phage integrase SAM-like domain-containing protein [Gemmatimonadaceae bacterium]
MAKSKQRKLASFGRRGDTVQVFITSDGTLARFEHRLHTQRILTKSWPSDAAGRKEALAFANDYWATRSLAAPLVRDDLTLLEMWQAFQTDQFHLLRENTQTFYRDAFAYWMLFHGEHFLVSRSTMQMVSAFRETLAEKGGHKGKPLAVNTIRGLVRGTKRVYAWAKKQGLIRVNPIADYEFRVAKDRRPKPPPEFGYGQFLRLLDAFEPRRATHWRPLVALALCGFQGKRSWMVLHLRVDDITLGKYIDTPDGPVFSPGSIRWRSEWEKYGRDEEQPLRWPAQLAIEVALEWRERLANPTGWMQASRARVRESEWLFPAAHRTKTGEMIYSPQSLWWALKSAQKRAGVDDIRGRASHGLRKLLAGEVWAQSNDFLLGLQAIGDTDPRRAREYLQKRDSRLIGAFSAMDQRWIEGRHDDKVQR